MDFTPYVENIKASFKKDQLKVFDAIKELPEIKLASLGSNDVEGYQVFTPEFIVKKMTDAVGKDSLDFNKTVLEPTSGDGAFTVYILQKRLEKAAKDDDFGIASLKALSTIYSIEMDKELIEKQRDNVFTLIKQFVEKNGIEVGNGYLDLVKTIIVTNFMWAMFNSDEVNCGLLGVQVAYAMPNAEKKQQSGVYMQMPVWSIKPSGIALSYEEVEA